MHDSCPSLRDLIRSISMSLIQLMVAIQPVSAIQPGGLPEISRWSSAANTTGTPNKNNIASRRDARKPRQTSLASLRDAINLAPSIPVMALR
jgi:hypothetical protein